MVMGKFARLAQATYLLGQVLQNVSHHNVDNEFQNENAAQLDRTLRSLIILCDNEGEIKQLSLCGQSALCYRYKAFPQSYTQPTS